MNETLKRAISGAVYIVLLLVSILFSTESFYLLFGILLIISIYEFCNLIQINKVFPLLFGTLLYSSIALISSYKKETSDFFIKNLNINLNLDIDINKTTIIL